MINEPNSLGVSSSYSLRHRPANKNWFDLKQQLYLRPILSLARRQFLHYFGTKFLKSKGKPAMKHQVCLILNPFPSNIWSTFWQPNFALVPILEWKWKVRSVRIINSYFKNELCAWHGMAFCFSLCLMTSDMSSFVIRMCKLVDAVKRFAYNLHCDQQYKKIYLK